MIGQLTAHLFQTGTLAIPHIGIFQLEHHPAVLHFRDRLLHAPYTTVAFSPSANSTSNEFTLPAGDLEQFGSNLKAHLQSQSFSWQGIGSLQLVGGSVSFVPEEKVGLAPVPANKVLRENRQHALLVGDREESSDDTSFMEEQEEPVKNWLWIGWVILLLTLVFIGWHFYKKGTFGSDLKIHTSSLHHLSMPFIRS